MLKKGDLLHLISRGAAAPIAFASPLIVKKTASRMDDDDESDPAPEPAPAAAENIPTPPGVQDLDNEPPEDDFEELEGEDDGEGGSPQLIRKRKPARRSKR
eukprot:4880245-Pleurochrysis_carterae.AAC.1